MKFSAISTCMIFVITLALELKRLGNAAFQNKNFKEAEDFYSEAIRLNMGSRPLWTNRAKCRSTMKKYDEAISDFESALSIDPKHTESIILKGNAFLSLGRFQEAGACYESLRSLGEATLADANLKKLHDIQEQV